VLLKFVADEIERGEAFEDAQRGDVAEAMARCEEFFRVTVR